MGSGKEEKMEHNITNSNLDVQMKVMETETVCTNPVREENKEDEAKTMKTSQVSSMEVVSRTKKRTKPGTKKGTFFRKPGQRATRAATRESVGVESSAMETEAVEISSSESDLGTSQSIGRGSRNTIEKDSNTSPPEKINVLNTGSKKPAGNRKRERSGSVSDSSRGRTTGDYVGRREAIVKYNIAKDEALQLDREKIIREYSNKELFKKAKINIEGIKEQMEELTNEELAEKVQDNLIEVLKIARTSNNLKGTYQKSLKMAAAASMGILQIFKDRATLSKEEARSEEVRALKREVATLRIRLEDEVESERRKALQAAGEAEAYKKELQALKKERPNRKDKTPNPKEGSTKKTLSKKSPRRIPSAKFTARDKMESSDTDLMEVEEEPVRKVVLDTPEN
ncbi:PREDICTED: uncharacterized protein LOC108758489 [Trachymyrmex cornetzi]|uniref:uncharacterized protein LOC108758489 n=1 Tax=Trachymyrmex cornetzi TaxID=471704 RepID=UPI00084F3D5F|nr:PREDICTED: uncharacterized protein LOC108758489 [Trachymyrmex cornetzi]